MLKKMMSILLILVMLLSMPVPTFAASGAKTFTDVASDYWGKASIDYISSRGYMVGYGDRFGILDPVTEGQYLAVLCRIFGYENLSPLDCEQPARDLGLVLNNETIDIHSNLKRDRIAKYTIRAFEKLNPGVSYPTYLEAYKSMITDYDSLKEDLKLTALKCVEKGLLAGGPDGKFNPDDETTRAQAAAFIHRILEQSERNKVKPVFATPDPEFEAFMASPEAKKYCSVENISKVVDGKIVFGGGYQMYTGDVLLPVWHNKEANKEAYELLKNLVLYAKDNGHFVRVFCSSDNSSVWFKYFENERYSYSYETYSYYLTTIIHVKPYKYQMEQKNDSYYTWVIGTLIKDGIDDWAAINYRCEDMTKAVEIAFKTIYGETLGQKVFDFAIGEYDKERDYWFNRQQYYHNPFLAYRPDLENLEISCNNTAPTNMQVYFTTNKKK